MTHEVSVAAYAAFAATNGRRVPTQPTWWGATDRHPIVNVTWDEAEAFCASHGGRLPTADEWQFAAAITDVADGLPAWGDGERREANLLDMRGSDRWEFSSPVGSFPPNRFGLFDMTGNVWEWTTTAHERSNPSYDVRVILGGSWDTPARGFPRRTGLSRQGRHNLYVGFRCAA
jgi:formylglycine-generating enzyme required for sulfatase activity